MDDVRKPSAQVLAMSEDWPMIDALMGGTTAMRKAGRRFLPTFPREDPESYRDRLATATLFPAYERTVSILVGKPFSKPVTLGDDVPPRIADLMGDVSLDGRNLHTFAADIAADALAYGFCGVLVDCPPNPAVQAGRKPTIADERAAGVRPYFAHIRPQNVLGWRSETRGGKQVLTQLRLLETAEEPSGPFGTKTTEQVRVLEPGSWQIWRKSAAVDGYETWVLHEQGTTTLDVIPFVPFYGRRIGFMVGRAPMLELAHSNIEHWQNKSDQQTILHVARVPILFARGLGDQEIVIGANSFITTGSETAEVRFVEHSGAAIEAGRLSVLDLEDRMRQAGAELLVIKPGNTTTVQIHAENEQAKCDLQRMVQGLEDGFDQALALVAAWIGESNSGHVDIYDDFGAANLAEASANMLFGMQQAGALSHETLLLEMQRRGVVSSDLDIAKEIAVATAEAAARAAVAAGIQRQERISA
jgi:hypothetical protein